MMKYENPEILSIIVLIVFPQERSEIYVGHHQERSAV